MKEKIIGIVGGVGPYAGIDLTEKILNQSKAASDKEHLSVVLFSMPKEIADRTDFLEGETELNPAYGIYEVIKKMEYIGVEVAGIACNTAHVPQIYNTVLKKMEKDNCKIKLLNIVEEVVRFIKENYPYIVNVGVLSTAATDKAGIYKNALIKNGFTPVLPSNEIRELVNRCIYDPEYGIKTYSKPTKDIVKKGLLQGFEVLIENHAEAIILGCTELPLAIEESVIHGRVLIDSSFVLARALIREAAPEKLKSLR